MERYNTEVTEAQQVTDELDHKPAQEMMGFIALADALLEHKEPNNPLTFVDLVPQATPEKVLERIYQTRIGDLLIQNGEQMAIESDGSYYPKLDLRKQNGELAFASVRAYGWQVDKVRYGDDDYKMYDGEFDKIRELSVSFGYRFPHTFAVERLLMYGSTSLRGLPSISRSLYVPDYVETGYEGHEIKSLANVTGQDAMDFMSIITMMVGDEPVSLAEYQRRSKK